MEQRVAKASLKLTGIYDPWARGVRIGQLTRSDGTEMRVLVRPLETWPAALVQPVREEARLVSRLQVPGLLRVEYASAVAERPAVVHAFEGVASLARLRDELTPRGQLFPARAAVEVAAAVAQILAALHAASPVDVRFCQPTPTPMDVLIGVGGEVRLAGVRAMKPASPPSPGVPGYSPPSAAGDTGVYGVAALLYELLAGSPPPPAAGPPDVHDDLIRKSMMRIIGRPGDVPGDEVVQLLRRCLSSDPSVRGTPYELAQRLQVIAGASRSTPLRAWASALVPTIAGLLPAPEPPRRAAALPTADAEDTGRRRLPPPARVAERPTKPAPEHPPVYGLPGHHPNVVLPRASGREVVGPPMMLSTAAVRTVAPPQAPTGGQVPRTAVTKPRPAPVEESLTPPKPPGPGPGKPNAGPLPATPRPAPPTAAPIDRPVAAPRAAEPPGRGREPGPGPDGPRISVPIGGLALPEGPPPRRQGDTLITVVLSAALVGLIALLAVGFFLWKTFGSTPEVEAIPEAPVAPLETPGEAAVEPDPVPAAPPVVEVAATPAPQPVTVAPKPATPKPAATVAAPAEDPGDVRITTTRPAVSEPVVAAPEPEPPSVGPFRVEFRSGSDAVTSLEIRCKEGGGTGPSVVVDATPAGACRVTGRGADAPIVTQVNVSGNRTYTCFAAGSRGCR